MQLRRLHKGISPCGLFSATHGTTVSYVRFLPPSLETNLVSSSSDPEVPAKSPSMRSNSTSSAVSAHQSRLYSAKSPVLTGYRSPVASVNPGTPSGGDQIMMCSNCLNCQNRLQGSPASGNQLFNYSQGSNMSLFGSQSSSSTPPPGLDAIDQYLRSILRPEAFLPAAQEQGQISSSFWSNIDPNLSAMNTSVRLKKRTT